MKIREKFDDIADFERLLEQAAINAETAWQMDFIDELCNAYDDYGVNTSLSERQEELLRELANR